MAKVASDKTYASRMAIAIGESKKVELPPRVFRGRLTGFLFDSDKCFVIPGALSGVKEIKRFYDEHPGLEVLITGHADKTGGAEHNLKLSEERAQALAAFLQDKVDDWMPWYGSGTPAVKRWGTREDQHMLTALGHYTGPIHGRFDDATKAAIKAFGAETLDDAGRKKLVDAYMKIDETTLPAGTKIVCHGCGESHPAGDDDDENRRVEVFFFEGPITPEPPSPCPSGGCSQYEEWKKHLVETIDLRVRRDLVAVTVSLRDLAAQLIKDAPYRMKAGDRSCHGRSKNGEARLLVPIDAERCLVEWGRKDDADLPEDGGTPTFQMELYMHYDLGSDEEQARMRLHNLGYVDSLPLDEALTEFQGDHDLEETGKLDEPTKQKLIEFHGTLAKPVDVREDDGGE